MPADNMYCNMLILGRDNITTSSGETCLKKWTYEPDAILLW